MNTHRWIVYQKLELTWHIKANTCVEELVLISQYNYQPPIESALQRSLKHLTLYHILLLHLDLVRITKNKLFALYKRSTLDTEVCHYLCINAPLWTQKNCIDAPLWEQKKIKPYLRTVWESGRVFFECWYLYWYTTIFANLAGERCWPLEYDHRILCMF